MSRILFDLSKKKVPDKIEHTKELPDKINHVHITFDSSKDQSSFSNTFYIPLPINTDNIEESIDNALAYVFNEILIPMLEYDESCTVLLSTDYNEVTYCFRGQVNR